MTNNVDLEALPQQFKQAVEAIRSVVPAELASPKWGIICGSGLSGLASSLTNPVHVPYTSIPGFSESTVEGHKSSLAFGLLSDIPVVACLGRFHTYEGHSAASCVFPTRVMKLLGVQALIVTNAAGGLHDDFEVGTIMAIHDHLSLPTLTSMNPLIGSNLNALGPRFPPLSNAYDLELRMALYKAAERLGLSDSLASGTYAYVLGPSYESRADARFLKTVGADAVGMSTVPEVIAATHAGMKVLAISLITNKVVLKPYFDFKKAIEEERTGGERVEDAVQRTLKQDIGEAANHEEVLEAGAARAEDMRKLVAEVVASTQL
ncbi:related to PNP1 - purine-nucleoside phosphorylase [Ustilago trichophora]|uniref:Purine nucleoside phosphorylase n=1 Tax=Ustilago trichophora TaxID=86804 RepID=A0A5C3EP96_9BASI|nr:related to PNP1 - purine-nucleoside phosphorylase [Ustilago trichophora]